MKEYHLRGTITEKSCLTSSACYAYVSQAARASKLLKHLMQTIHNLILGPRYLSRKLQSITIFMSSQIVVKRHSQENFVYSCRMVLKMHKAIHLLIAGRVNTGKFTVGAQMM